LSCWIICKLATLRISSLRCRNKQTVVSQHSWRKRSFPFVIGRNHCFASIQIAHGYRFDLNTWRGEFGNSQHCARGRDAEEILFEDGIEQREVVYVFEVHLDINNMLHGQAHGLDNCLYVFKSLGRLFGELAGNGAILATAILSRQINIAIRNHRRRALGRNRVQLSIGGARNQQSNS
jgi:hypothetical protein